MDSKRKMIVWTGAVMTVVIALIVLIVRMEPASPGITRAQASKAVALLNISKKECETLAAQRESSRFPEKERNNWFIKYMEYLYDEGYLSEELTEPTLKSAQGQLTYKEANQLAKRAGRTLTTKVGLTRRNRDQPFPQDRWEELFAAMREKVDPDGNVKEVTAALFGTPSNLTNAASWTAYTTEGTYGFEGLALDHALDCEIRFLERDGEMLALEEVVSRKVTYSNLWITEEEDGKFLARLGKVSRSFDRLDGQNFSQTIADLHFERGNLKKITVKPDRIHGKVLAVGDGYIEIEGYGRLELDPNFQVYRVYGDFQVLSPKDILVGYDLQEFVPQDGKLCAALIEREFDADTIRVLLMNTGFGSIFHERVDLTVTGPATLQYDKGDGTMKSEKLKDGGELTIEADDPRLEHGRLEILPENDEAITIRSMERGQGNPTYGGSLEIRKEEGGLVLVNDIFLEDYLKKVVSSEMPASYEKEALKAQAVCARTYAYRQIQANAYSQYGAHVDDSTNYQVYNNKAMDEKTTAAVNETYGKMLFYQGKPAETYYFSTSCGHTTDGSIWGSAGANLSYLQAVELRDRRKTLDLTDNQTFDAFIRDKTVASYDSSFAMYRWETKLSAKTLEQKVNTIGSIENVAVTERGPGGIATRLEITGSAGTTTISGQGNIRSTLGNTELVFTRKDKSKMEGQATLPSAFISIEKRAERDGSISFYIYGGGYGHGVGMSQNGAQGMAKAGKTWKEILEFFYQGTEIQESN